MNATRNTALISFNPRPRTEGDGLDHGGDDVLDVSIHALARRATRGRVVFRAGVYHVSIHALARRATPRCGNRIRPLRCFNPRPRTEGDKGRATRRPAPICFNPRPRTEGDKNAAGHADLSRSFNPRPRTEGDKSCWPRRLAGIRVSIHALARRATARKMRGLLHFIEFQSTPSHGGRPLLYTRMLAPK